MATNTITFGGTVLPCTVERFPGIKKAERKYRQFNIPGRNGDIFFQSDAWENVIQSYQIYCGNDTDSEAAQKTWTSLAKCLALDGYQTLSDTYDTLHFRKAVFNGPLDIENAWNTHGRATIEFNCRPERYRNDGQTPITYNAQASWVSIVDLEGLDHEASQYAKTWAETYLPFEKYFYLCKFGAISAYNDVVLWFDVINNGELKYFFVTDDDETPALQRSISTTSSRVTIDNLLPYGQHGVNVVIPYSYLNSFPIVYISDSGDEPEVYGAEATLVNLYMPTHPTIVLHRVADHYSVEPETMAFRVGGYAIFITQTDVNTPEYYFIDSENMVIKSADTLTGHRSLASNARMDAGLTLESGENSIFTSLYYDVTLTPNWWEL